MGAGSERLPNDGHTPNLQDVIVANGLNVHVTGYRNFAIARTCSDQHDDYSDIHTTTTTFGIGESFVARCLLKTGPLFFIRVGSGACQLPISGVSWVTASERGEASESEPNRDRAPAIVCS